MLLSGENETEHSRRPVNSALFDICALSFLLFCDWIFVLVFVFVVVFVFIGKYKQARRASLVLCLTFACALFCSIQKNLFVPIADSAQIEYCTTFHCPTVRASVTGVTSHISHIYTRHKCHVKHQGSHQTLYILNQNRPGYLSSKD